MTWLSSRKNRQLEQIRRESSNQIQSFQHSVLEKMQEILKSIERERSQTNSVYLNVIQLKEEMKQIHTQVDALVVHLLMPDLPLQKIREAIVGITEYHTILQKREQSLYNTRQMLIPEITRFISALEALVSSPQPITDGHLKSVPSSPVYESEASPESTTENTIM